MPDTPSLDLDDPATLGVLWAVLSEAIKARDDVHYALLDSEGGFELWIDYAETQPDGTVSRGKTTAPRCATVAEAILYCWGEP